MLIKIFKKTYTRDYSMMIEEAWYNALKKILPEEVPTVFYMNDGVIEIWEDEEVMKKISKKVLEIDVNNILEVYQNKARKVEQAISLGKVQNISELKQFVNDMFSIMKDWAILYLICIKSENKLANKFREEDTFFDDCDKVIRNSLITIFPELESYETTIIKNDLDNVPSKELLIKRKSHFVVIPNNVVETITLKEFSENNLAYNFQIDVIDQDVKELVGQVAFPGKVQGKVKIIKRKEQIPEMEEGKILVSPMTTPEYVIVMEKAAAIVTDEGGMLCHAAIVAREMKKPCITGTKIATQILKDGDLVEIDAEKGIVRKLK